MSKKRARVNKTTNNNRKPNAPEPMEHAEPARRDIHIDRLGIRYDLDSDDIDALEREHAEKGAPLSTPADYRYAFERALIKRVGATLDKASARLARIEANNERR